MTVNGAPARLRACAGVMLTALGGVGLVGWPSLNSVQAQPSLTAVPSPSAQVAANSPFAPTTPCVAVPVGAQRIDGGAVQAWWLPEPSPLQVGKPFALLVTLCPTQARLLRLDAHMPEHRHGMNYRPSVQALGEGRWRAEGLLWHMPGRWEWVLDTELAAQKHRLVHSVLLR